MADKVLGIFGHPVAHSLSPAMHNHAARLLGLGYAYVAFDVRPESLRRAVESVRTLGIVGVNVTVPHKEKVARLVDKLDGDAKIVGAVNTITLKDGRLIGTNTDGVGFLRSLTEEKINPAGKTAVIIGAGGSSCSIGLSLLRAGASGITVVNRSSAGGEKLVRLLSPFGKISFVPSSSPSVADAFSEADIVVQTTPLGMKKSDPLPIANPSFFHSGQIVYDIIYAPEKTKLLKWAEKKGARTMNGLTMLVQQGSESFKTWTGQRFPEKKVLGFLKKLLKERADG
jgi:shikimate dehydrogenase